MGYFIEFRPKTFQKQTFFQKCTEMDKIDKIDEMDSGLDNV